MGVWATGLYAGDFALDLRSTIGAVAKLPFDGDRLLDILCESERAAGDRSDDPDHSTFWLVVADQFARRGIENKRAREIALEIIDSNSDLAMLEKLGMAAQDLRKRKKVLDEVRERIIVPTVRAKPLEVMRNPQLLLMQTGDVLVYPTFGAGIRILSIRTKTGGARRPGPGKSTVGRRWSSSTPDAHSISLHGINR